MGKDDTAVLRRIEKYVLLLACTSFLTCIALLVLCIPAAGLARKSTEIVVEVHESLTPQVVQSMVSSTDVLLNRTALMSEHFPSIAASVDGGLRDGNSTYLREAASYTSGVMESVSPEAVGDLIAGVTGAAVTLSQVNLTALSDPETVAFAKMALNRTLTDAEEFLTAIQRAYIGFAAMGGTGVARVAL